LDHSGVINFLVNVFHQQTICLFKHFHFKSLFGQFVFLATFF
jgi:hypothetical protein